MNILVINGHKYYPYAKGELNKTLFNKITEVLKPYCDVETTVIEEGYDVQKEVEKINKADIIIFQSPIYWYSVPHSFKEYFDVVYTVGNFARPAEKYGFGGILKDKKYMYSLTLGAPKEAYTNTLNFFDERCPDEVFIALHKIQQYCGMEKIKSFFVFDSTRKPNIEEILNNLEKHLKNNILLDAELI